MANRKLGIDVEIKYPEVRQIKESISESLKSAQDSLSGGELKLDLKLDNSKAMSGLRQVREEYKTLRDEVEKGIELKVIGVEQQNKTIKETTENVKKASKAQESSDSTRMQRLREIVSIQKEINSLQTKKVGASAQDQAIYNKRIEELSMHLKLAKNEYQDLFKTSADDDWMLNNVKRVGEFNVELRESQQAQRQTNELFKEYTGLLNDEFRIQKELQTAGESQKSVLQEQLTNIRLKRGELLEHKNLEEQMTDAQRAAVVEMVRQNDYQQKLTQAKREDKEIADRQNATFREMRTSLNEIHKIQLKVTELQAKSDAGVTTAREEDNLANLKMQLVVREDMYRTNQEIARSEGMISQEAEQGLSSLERQHTEKMNIAEGQAKINADLKVANNLYDDMIQSVRRVDSLNKDLASAGSREAEVIREAIRAEEDKQKSIRNTLKEQGMVNEAREREYESVKKLSEDQSKWAEKRSSASETDRYAENPLMGMLDPRRVFNQAKRVSMAIYDTIADLDSQLIAIEKVAAPTEKEMGRFRENIFDFASDVGKSADEYGAAVEKWVTQGFDLAEGTRMARESTIGAFIGNINEEDMIDYMSVPMAAFGDQGIEIEDILNSMNEVSNKTAANMGILGEAYKRASQTSATAGTSFAELTGLIAGAEEVTRFGGESIGTSLRMLDLNFSKMGAQLTKGETTKYNFFKDIGVDVNDANGELRSTYDIIGDLEGVWDNLSSKERSTASIYAGGSRHATVLQGIIKGWDKVVETTAVANEQIGMVDKESGSAYVEFEKQMSSIEFAAVGLKNAWAEFIHQLASREEITGIVNGLTGMVKAMTDIAGNDKAMSVIKTILGAGLWLTAKIAMDKTLHSMRVGFGGVFDILSGGTKPVMGVADSFLRMSKTGTVVSDALGSSFGFLGSIFRDSFSALGKFLPVIGLAAAAMTVLELAGLDTFGSMKRMVDGSGLASKAIKEYRETHEEASKTIRNNALVNNEFDEVNDLIKKYKDLNKEKEKESKKTNKSIQYSIEEYKEVRDAFNEQAEALDIDLQIRFNDYEHIKKQLEELEKKKLELEKKSTEELSTAIHESQQSPDMESSYRNMQDMEIATLERDRANLISRKAQTHSRELRADIDNQIEALDRQIKGFDRINKDFMDSVFNSKDFKDYNKDWKNRVQEFKQNKEDLLGVIDDIEPANMGSPEEILASSKALMSSFADVSSHARDYEELNKAIKNGNDLTDNQMELLMKLAPEYENYGNKVSEWEERHKGSTKNALELMSEEVKSHKKSSDAIEEKIMQLVKYADMDELTSEQAQEYMEKLQGSHAEMIEVFGELGEAGELAFGLSREASYMFGEEWGAVLSKMQSGIEEFPDEVVTKYNLLADDGFLNQDIINVLAQIPDDVRTRFELFDSDGVPRIEKIIEFLDEIPEDIRSDFNLDSGDADISMEKLSKFIEDHDEKAIEMFANMNSDEFDKRSGDMAEMAERLDETEVIPKANLNASAFDSEMELVKDELGIIDDDVATPKVDADKKDFDTKTKFAEEKTREVGDMTATVAMYGNLSDLEAKSSEADKISRRKREDVKINFVASISNTLQSWWNRATGGGVNVKVRGGSGSVAIEEAAQPSISGALSRSVSQSIGVSSTSESRRSDSNKNARVDTDVWRYWSKEMFRGLPLENSMNNLNRSIQNASEDNKKLISLYREQNKIIKQQVSYEKSMKKSQQAEMNSILSKLRKEGFRTSGNEITNLGIAKNMKGSKAERSNDLLSQYKSVYQAINSTNENIRQLNQDIKSNNQTIKDTQEAERERVRQEAIEKEAKSLEKKLKRASALITNITNDLSIFSTKLGMISDIDFELKLAVSEEGINKSSDNIKKLTDEFNRLSKTSVKYEENIDGIQSELEGLKGEILSNADSILAYRDAIKELEIQRMTSDFEKFSNVMDRNLDKISRNIDNLRDGLVSGTSLSDLESSSLSGLDFTRKTALEREYEQRLELERELDEALDAFAKKNVDRVKNVANSTLTVERSKYSALLKLAKGYSDGKVENVSISSPSKSIGTTKSDSGKNKEHQAWLKNLSAINSSYVKAYNEMVKKYDDAMKKATSASEKELITNAMIIEQLELQEDIYRQMIDSNNEAIKKTEDMLKDSSLTTEQREQLLETIEEYRESNMNAQDSIKDSIQSRFDLELDLIDEAIDRASKYTEELSNMMDIAQAVGSGDSVLNEIYRALYTSKVNEYAKATEIIEDLAKQQSEFEEGSFEWNILQEKILETQDSLSDLTLDILNANKDILGSQLDIIQEANEKLALGSSADDYDIYHKIWMDGVEKELELEKLRDKLAGLEDQTLRGKLELMDRQEKISRAELEYIDKQLEATRLQEKLENIRGERNIQTLTKDSEGRWQWEYVADQSEYDSTKDELDNIELELEKHREEQRREYVNEMNDIISRVRDGEFEDIGELEDAIADINDAFKEMLKDVSDMSLYDTEEIIKAYEDYLKNNDDVLSSIGKGDSISDNLAEVGKTFEDSFLNIAEDLGEVIADELKKALEATTVKGEGNYIIEKQVLEFPNVKDVDGLKEAMEELPQLARQVSTSK